MNGDQLKEVVESLGSSSGAERWKAEQKLRQMTAEEMRDLLAWSRMKEMSQGAMNVSAGCAAVGCGLYGAVVLFGVLVMMSYQPETAIPMSIFSLIPIGIAMLARRFISERGLWVESAALQRAESASVCAPILESLFGMNAKMRRIATECLVRLLSKLKASDSAAFSPAARKTLNTIVSTEAAYAYTEEFVASALESLIQIGDVTTVKCLERALLREPQDARETRFQARAKSVLASLKTRMVQENQAAILLRSSNPVSVEALLRPSPTSSNQHDILLVRPAESGESNP